MDPENPFRTCFITDNHLRRSPRFGILPRMQQRRGSLAKVLLTLVLGGALFYGGVVALGPWALHIGGRWTPLLTWQGSGKLVTKGGIEYPLWVSFFPSSHF